MRRFRGAVLPRMRCLRLNHLPSRASTLPRIFIHSRTCAAFPRVPSRSVCSVIGALALSRILGLYTTSYYLLV